MLADGLPGDALRRHGTGLQDHAARSSTRRSPPRRGCSCSTAPAIRPAPPTRARSCSALGEVLLEHPRIVIGTDDMYEKIYWEPEPFCSLVTAVPELYPRTVTINGVSKAYAMTGWRIGYCGGPKELIHAMSTIQGQSTSNASSISQKAATVRPERRPGCVGKMNAAFKERHDFVVRALNCAARGELPARRRHVLRLCRSLARDGRAGLP